VKVTPYLSFNNQCRSAFKFYEQVLGGKITFLTTWGESPMAAQCPPEVHDQIMHGTIQIGDQLLMGADPPPGNYSRPQGISITLSYNDTAEGERIFQALSEGGTVQMPYQKTFWAEGFGMCVDKFGIPWMVNSEAPKET
jgi:PhnB protein